MYACFSLVMGVRVEDVNVSLMQRRIWSHSKKKDKCARFLALNSQIGG